MNTTKYSDVVRTGVTKLCTRVRSERATSNLYIAQTPCRLNAIRGEGLMRARSRA